MIVFVSAVSFLTVLWVAEAENALEQVIRFTNQRRVLSRKVDTLSERSLLLPAVWSRESFVKRIESIVESAPTGGEGRSDFEVSTLVKAFLGPLGTSCYQLSLLVLTFVGLMAYCQVFVKSFNSQLHQDEHFFVPVSIFSAIVVPLSCIDLTAQVNIQVGMSIMRFITLGVLVIGLIFAITFDKMDSSEASDHVARAPFTSPHVPIFNYGGLGVMFSTSVFSQLFQHSVPGLTRPLSDQNKLKIPNIFGAALVTTSVLYIAIGCLSVLYFGSRILQSVNLNFVDFRWGCSSSLTNDSISILATSLSLLVVIFPAFDTLSIYPLIAHTLGSNILASSPSLRGVFTYVAQYIVCGFCERCGNSTEDQHRQVHKVTLVISRLSAAIPPIILCFYVTELAVTLQIAGVCGIFVALVAPALLQRNSYLIYKRSKTMSEVHPSPRYVDKLGGPLLTNTVLFIAVLAFVVCIGQLYNSVTS